MEESIFSKSRLYRIIFGHKTKEGRLFDIILLVAILISIIILMLDSVADIHSSYGIVLLSIEWVLTILFAAEYITRIYCSPQPWKYILSFYGVIDLLSILPTLLSPFFVGTHFLQLIRTFRLIRIFRIMGLSSYSGQAKVLGTALLESRHKIVVFLTVVLSTTIFIGAIMYVIEGPESGFTSIPRGIYWAIVTMTTVGYGDITPSSSFGQALSALLMIIGYAIIAVPTGIVSTTMVASQKNNSQESCHKCKTTYPTNDSQYCYHCGTKRLKS